MTGHVADWRLVARKELGDLLGRLGRKPLTRTLGVVVIFGLLIPLRFPGAANLPAFFAVFMAFVPARLVAIESFAGERERGTLESLLALPLSDPSLAVGKVVAATLYGAVRGWLFVAVWLPAAALLSALGVLPATAMPRPGVVVLTLVGSLVVAAVAGLFGVWQSAAAPSVRAILESGGLLRLVLIVVVFFVAPWLLGLLSPDGSIPSVPMPGGGQEVSLGGMLDAVGARPRSLAVLAATAAAGTAVGMALLVRDTLRRCRRERLALVPDTTRSG